VISVYEAITAPHASHSTVSVGRLPKRSDARPAGIPATSPHSPATLRPRPTEVAERPTIRVK
jgi:hypothetical protein